MNYINVGIWTLQEISKYILYYPLRTLYFHGPSLGNFGFWGGKAREDICSQLTLMPAKTWTKGFDMEEECELLLQKKFNSFYISILFIFYVYFSYSLLSYMYVRYFFWKPFLKDIHELLEYDTKKKLLKKN